MHLIFPDALVESLITVIWIFVGDPAVPVRRGATAPVVHVVELLFLCYNQAILQSGAEHKIV